MSTTTSNLGLFEYDPVADANQTYNITNALNNNWDTIDSATGKLSDLTTTEKGSLVGAINELNNSSKADTDLSNLTATGENHFTNKDLSNLSNNGNAKLQYAPFSINNGVVDANGNNATLTYSGTTLTCQPCTITTADGRTKTFDSNATLDCSSLADDTYKVLKDYTTGSLSAVSNITVNKVAPTTPTSGDCWLDTSSIPLSFKTYDGLTWNTDNDKVYLGDVKIESNAITKITNNVFNQQKADEIVKIAHRLDFANAITISTTSQSGSQSYICPTEGVVLLTSEGHGTNSTVKGIHLKLYYLNTTNVVGEFWTGYGSGVGQSADYHSVMYAYEKGDKVYFVIYAYGYDSNGVSAKFIPFKKS